MNGSASENHLAAGAAVAYYAEPEHYRAEAQRARLLAVLDPEERARYRRFRFDDDRLCYLVAHALTRRALSSLAAVPPEAWRFSVGRYGRPEVATPETPRRIRFNLSHTRTLVACVLALEHDVGIDVEDRSRGVEIDRVSRSVLSPPELADLEAQADDAASRTRFFRYWTLKEAYIKAVGQGLGMPLRKIAFDLNHGEAVNVRLDDIDDDPGSWSFHLCEPTARHQLAIALRSRAPDAFQVSAFEL